MDDRIPQNSKLLASVVRDFVSSRLERQLLAQAIELAWHGSPAAGDSGRVDVRLPRPGRGSSSAIALATASSATGG